MVSCEVRHYLLETDYSIMQLIAGQKNILIIPWYHDMLLELPWLGHVLFLQVCLPSTRWKHSNQHCKCSYCCSSLRYTGCSHNLQSLGQVYKITFLGSDSYNLLWFLFFKKILVSCKHVAMSLTTYFSSIGVAFDEQNEYSSSI